MILGIDPLDDYFHSYGGFAGGGLFSEQRITVKPLSTDLELNEWKSLPPGEYKLKLLSKRVSVGSEDNPRTWNAAPVPIESNWITFRVSKAEPAWQSSVLTSAVKALDNPKSTEDEKENAGRKLRFLNSEDAARELVRHFWMSSPESLRWEFEAGLWGNPFRRTVIQGMKTTLRELRDRTRDWFIDVLVDLELQTDSRFRLLRYGTQFADHEKDPGSAYQKGHKCRASEYASETASGTLK